MAYSSSKGRESRIRIRSGITVTMAPSSNSCSAAAIAGEASRSLISDADMPQANHSGMWQSLPNGEFTKVVVECHEYAVLGECASENCSIAWVRRHSSTVSTSCPALRGEHAQSESTCMSRATSSLRVLGVPRHEPLVAHNAVGIHEARLDVFRLQPGVPFQHSSGVSPRASCMRTCSTAYLRPRIVGLPPRMSRVVGDALKQLLDARTGVRAHSGTPRHHWNMSLRWSASITRPGIQARHV